MWMLPLGKITSCQCMCHPCQTPGHGKQMLSASHGTSWMDMCMTSGYHCQGHPENACIPMQNDGGGPRLARDALVLGPSESINQASSEVPLWNKLLKQPHNQMFHSNLEFLNLHVWLLESRRNSHIGSPSVWKRELELLREPSLEPYTLQGGSYMGNGVNRTRWMSNIHLFLK